MSQQNLKSKAPYRAPKAEKLLLALEEVVAISNGGGMPIGQEGEYFTSPFPTAILATEDFIPR